MTVYGYASLDDFRRTAAAVQRVEALVEQRAMQLRAYASRHRSLPGSSDQDIVECTNGAATTLEVGDICYFTHGTPATPTVRAEQQSGSVYEYPRFGIALDRITQNAKGRVCVGGACLAEVRFPAAAIGDNVYLSQCIFLHHVDYGGQQPLNNQLHARRSELALFEEVALFSEPQAVVLAGPTTIADSGPHTCLIKFVDAVGAVAVEQYAIEQGTLPTASFQGDRVLTFSGPAQNPAFFTGSGTTTLTAVEDFRAEIEVAIEFDLTNAGNNWEAQLECRIEGTATFGGTEARIEFPFQSSRGGTFGYAGYARTNAIFAAGQTLQYNCIESNGNGSIVAGEMTITLQRALN